MELLILAVLALVALFIVVVFWDLLLALAVTAIPIVLALWLYFHVFH
jgi:hypothetical protein